MKTFFNIFKKDILQNDTSNSIQSARPEMLKNYLSISTSIILALDKYGKITYINMKGAAMLGLPAERLTGMDWFDNFVPKEDISEVRKGFDKIISGKIKLFEFNENPVVDVKGRKKIIAWHNAVIYGDDGSIAGTVSSGDDITALKESNEKLKQSVNKYEVTLETTTSAIASVDSSEKIVEYNRAAAEIFGVNKSEMLGKSIASIMTPVSVIKAMTKLNIVRTKGHSYGGEYQVKSKNGEIKDVIISSAAVKDDKGKFLKTISVIEDVTERKYMEGVLRDSEEKYRTMFNSVSDAVFVHQLSPNGDKSRFIAVNEIACARLGYSREELLKLGLFDITEPEKVPLVKKAVRKMIKDGRLSGEAVHVAKGGKKIQVEVNASVFKLGNKLTAIATARDITQRKKNEKMLSEQTVFAGLRARLWQLAADKSLSEQALVRSMLDSIGPALDCVRVIHSVMDDGYLKAVMEWKSGKAVPSALGTKVPEKITQQLGLENQKVLDVAVIKKMIPAALKPFALPLLKVLLKKFGDTPSILTPYYLYGKWAGCINCTAKSLVDGGLWSGERKQLLSEAARIISAAVEARRTERIIEKQLAFGQLRAELWRLAADISTPEEALIQLLLDKTGPVVGAERMFFGNPDRDKFRIKLEWKAGHLKKDLIGYSFPLEIYNKFELLEQVVFDSKCLSKAAPKALRLVLNAFMRVLTKMYGDKPSLVTPYLIRGKKEGVIICSPVSGKNTWTDDEKQVVLEAAQIITRIIENRRAGTIAKESSMKYKSLFDGISEAVYVSEITGGMNILDVNDAACARTGHTKKEILTMNMTGLFEKTNGVFSREDLSGTAGEKKVQFETEQIAKNGRRIPVEIKCNIIEYDGKQVFITIVKDLTDEKKTRATEELRSFYSALSAEIWRIAADLSLDENTMIDMLLKRVGSDFKASRVSYSTEIKGNIVGVNQWAAEGVKSTIAHTSPAQMLGVMKKETIYEVEPGSNFDFLPIPMKSLVKRALLEVMSRFGLKSVIAVPVVLDGKIGGVISMDVESSNTAYPGLDDNRRRIILDLVNIVAQGIARRRAEKKIEQSEKLYREVFNNANDAIVLQELIMKPGEPPNSRILDFNDMTCKIFEMKREEMKGLKLQSLMDEEGMKRIRATTKVVIAGEVRDEVMAMRTMKGRSITVEIRSKTFDFGEIQILLSVVRDITDREKAEAALKESEELYRTLINTSPDAVIMSDMAGKIIFSSERMAKLHGYVVPGDIIGRSIFDFVDTQSREIVTKEFVEFIVRGTQANMEYKALRRNGSTFTGEINASILMGPGTLPKGVIATIRDISERVRAVEALRLSEEKYRNVISRTGQLIYEYDVNNGTISWGGAVEEITGYSEEEYNREISIDLWTQMIYPGDRARVIKEHEKAQHACGKYYCEYRYRHKNGSYIYVEDEATFISGEDGNACRMLGVMKNITQRKENEAAVIESEEKFRKLSEQSLLGIAILQDNVFVYFNDAFSKMNGYSREEIARWTPEDFYRSIHEDDIPVVKERLTQRASGNHLISSNFQLRIYAKDRRIKWLDVYETDTIYKGKQALFITEADITALKEAENKLKISVGELTRSNAELEQFAYVASHDLQEPLRMVSSYVQLLKRRYEGKLGQDADDFIGFAVDGADRMQKLIKDLLVYSRIGSNKKAHVMVDLKKVLDTVILNMAQTISETGAVITTKDLPQIFADEAQMVQVIQNLISNAVKFTSQGSKPEIEISAVINGAECTVAVKDNGIGIAKEYFDKIFVIFQRLHGKEEYPGTGIGLSICRKIVESHGGRIWLESTEGKGTTFYFTVPMVEK